MDHSTSSVALKPQSTLDIPHNSLRNLWFTLTKSQNPVVYPVYTYYTYTHTVFIIISTIVLAADDSRPLFCSNLEYPLMTSSSTRSWYFMRIEEKHILTNPHQQCQLVPWILSLCPSVWWCGQPHAHKSISAQAYWMPRWSLIVCYQSHETSP